MAGEVRGATVVVNCAVCNDPFTARVADRKRGWAKCCSKSCAATRRTAASSSGWDRYAATIHPFSSEAFEP